jgi:competence protein ComFC
MGIYYPKRYEKRDLLSKHIISLKNDKRYAIPLGVALFIVMKNRYPDLCAADLMTAVPLSREEYNVRGFNQSIELANIVGSELGIKVEHLLFKSKTLAMKGRSYDERKALVQGLYQVLKSKIGLIYGKYILLVDDVVTSGFTVSECSKVLKNSGAKEVDVIALARTASGEYGYV